MPATIIRYGDSHLVLHKSSTLVGLRPAHQEDGALTRTLAHHRTVAEPQRLGGFQMVNVAWAANADDALDQLRSDKSVQTGTHVYYTSDDGVPFVPTGTVYIVFDDDAPLPACQTLIDEHHLQIAEVRGTREILCQISSASVNPIKTAASLQLSPYIKIAEPELASPGKLTSAVLAFDSQFERQWYLHNTGILQGSPLNMTAGADARVRAAWDEIGGFGGREVVVAVIDDGFDLAHPDLSGPGKIVAPQDFMRGGSDPSPQLNPGQPQSPTFNPQQQRWVGDWHGTACAGVAVGEANGSGILGAAPQARFMPVRWGVNLADGEVEAWFDYVRTQGAWVVSCSWSAAAAVFRLSTRQANAIARCAHEGRGGRGAVICFAAGNENRDIDSPAHSSLNGFATHPDVVAVAASTSRDQRAHYSNFGKAIAVCAPSSGHGGRDIFTTEVSGSFTAQGSSVDAGYSAGDFTSSFSGTSSATPLVAGICALLLSVNPHLTAAEVKQIIQATARKIGPAAAYDGNGHSPLFGHGCIDALAAVKAARVSGPAAAAADTADVLLIAVQ